MIHRLWFIKVFLLLLHVHFFSLLSFAQKDSGEFSLQLTVTDARTNEKLEFATVSLRDSIRKRQFSTITDTKGMSRLKNIPQGEYQLHISFIGYQKLLLSLVLDRDTSLTLFLTPTATQLKDIIVTASESRGLTSSSRIDRKAMELLQPSSFSDILSLIPGHMSQDPALGKVNLIGLREVGTSSEQYNTSSLGTSFMIDGVPISTDANMQYVLGSSQSEKSHSLDITGKGVDMRTIPTDDIETVQIIRGIPSVEFGDLTSGLIKIKRKTGYTEWEARFKADPGSKLFYVGKGFSTSNNWNFNIGIDYLNAKPDPRNNLEIYKRFTTSLRIYKQLKTSSHEVNYNLNLDYGGSFDNQKSDPDISYQKVDRYKSTYNRMAISNQVEWKTKKELFIRSFSLLTAVNYQKDQIKQTKFVSLNRDTPIPTHDEEGEYDGVFLPYQYTANLLVDGQPINAYAKATSNLQLSTYQITHNIKAGIEWSMDKNLGRGQVYDLARPLYPSMSARPRPYKDIPAGHELSFFVEDVLYMPIKNHDLTISAGIRSLSSLNLKSTYRMHGKLYWDPRINILWSLPSLFIKGDALKVQIAGGIGWHTKVPVLADLYPNLIYRDFIQFNYYHTNETFRRINIRTYKIDPTNYELEPARNKKIELRADLSYRQHLLSVTYFHEQLNSGFRNSSRFRTFEYKKYDNNSVDASQLQGPPDLNKVSYILDTVISSYNITTNGSTIRKEGIEFQYSSQRIPFIQTKITINGAWFKSIYRNSQPIYSKPSVILGGKELPYVGLYKDDSGYNKQQLNTNFTFDTYLPSLGLSFATSVQCMWFSNQRNMKQNGIPIKYIDIQGIEHDYTEADKTHAERQWLTVNYNDILWKKQTEPLYFYVNFKATKTFKERVRLALFVNKMLDYTPDYTSNGIKVRRNVTPYFGMELNLKL